ncbi:hypothetical protein WN943_004049 [Citrus x changshan-huyou]
MPSAGIQGAAASQYLGFLNRTNDGNMNNNVFGIDRKITVEMRPSLVRKITAELVRLHGRAHTHCCPATAANDGRFFGLGEMGEREIVWGEIRERDILVSKKQKRARRSVSFLAAVEALTPRTSGTATSKQKQNTETALPCHVVEPRKTTGARKPNPKYLALLDVSNTNDVGAKRLELDPSIRNVVVEQLIYVGRKDRSSAVKSYAKSLQQVVSELDLSSRNMSFGLDTYKSYAKSLQQVVSELDPSIRNVVVEQLRYVGRKDRSSAVVSSEGGIVELCPTLASKGEMLGFIRW